MVSNEYSEAIAEVLDILEHTHKEDINKIPLSFMNFLKDNASKEYKPNLDHSKRIKDMQLKEKTIGILSVINSKFWCTEDEKIEFDKKLKENEEKYQKELRKKYNPDNIFNKRTLNIPKEELSIVKVKHKESIFVRLLNFIKKYFIK